MKTELNLTAFTNVSFVHAVQLHAHHIGGILKPILAHQFSCKPTDGLLTLEINTQKKDLKKLSKDIKLEECQNIGMCTVTCPKGLNPQSAIQELLRMVKELEENKAEDEVL